MKFLKMPWMDDKKGINKRTDNTMVKRKQIRKGIQNATNLYTEKIKKHEPR